MPIQTSKADDYRKRASAVGMRGRAAALFVGLTLAGCWPERLSKDEQIVLQAVSFLAFNIEDGYHDDLIRSVSQKVAGKKLNIVIETADEQTPTEYRKIKMALSQRKTCIFRVDYADSDVWFEWDLNRTSRISHDETSLKTFVLEGVGIECRKTGCKDKTFWSMGDKDKTRTAAGTDAILGRRNTAMEHLKKHCPGKLS